MSYYQCPYCWDTGNRQTRQTDHIIPTSRGGCNCKEYKVYTHRYCNDQKHDKTPLEYFAWLNGKGHYDHWKYTKKEKKELLAQLAELEINAVTHMKKVHNIRPSFWD